MSAQEGQQQQQQQQAPQGQQLSDGPLDSITLGHLRNLVKFGTPKSRQFDFPFHADTDTIRNEIDEFYSYVEAPQTAENRSCWEEWCSLPPQARSGGVAGTGANEAGAGGELEPDADGRDVGEREYSSEEPVGSSGLAEDGGALGLGLGINEGTVGGGGVGSGPGVGSGAGDRMGDEGPKRKSGGSIVGEWTTLPSSARRRTVQSLLSTLEVRDPETRLRASRALLYILQGAFADTSGPEHQLHWLLENARMVRSLGGLGDIFAACKIACWKHDWLSSLPDHIPSTEPGLKGAPAAPLLTPEAKAEYLDEINLELALHFAQLYSLIEANRGDEEWGDELMSLEPPLPIYLFNLVAALREKSAKGYPVKKLLLLLWKSILCCFGGMEDVNRCKMLAREIEGLTPTDETKKPRGKDLKANPIDFVDFTQELSAKYPTFIPPKHGSDLPLEKIASAVSPIPARRPMTSGVEGINGDQQGQGSQQVNNNMSNGNGNAAGFPGTPAPSPPPSPKPNKQKYQTDQTRPFVFPYSRSVQGDRMVPYSIEEAGKLFKENMHVSLELWQTWRLREQCIHDESGVASAADGTRVGLGDKGKGSRYHGWGGKNEMTHGFNGPSPLARFEAAPSSSQGSRSPSSTEGPPASQSQQSSGAAYRFKVKGEATLEHLVDVETEIEEEIQSIEADHLLAAMDNDRYIGTLNELRQKRADVRRLQRIDMLYRAILPQMQSSVIVLLKLLLATVTAGSTNSAHAQAIADGVPHDDAPPPTLEDVDVARHREILTKAVSAILLLSLKWFKVSHVMKYNYFSQVLVDSNVLLLILKIFGLQEVSQAVRAINEADEFRFFNYCFLNGGREARNSRAEDSLISRQDVIGPMPINIYPTSPGTGTTCLINGQEVEMIKMFNWRNLFSSINFTRILQKLTKRKVHRILLLVQYKSSQILKKTLKVPHPGLELYALKILKSQVPFCGRKWRQSNMKIITSIYLHCRPDLRDEWLAGSDIDADVEESLPQEQALRSLVKFYNNTRFGNQGGGGVGGGGHAYRRSMSTSNGGATATDSGGGGGGGGNAHHQNEHGNNNLPHYLLSPGGRNGANATGNSFFENDILPPLRRNTASSTPGGYIPDDVVEGYLDTYEDVLGEVFGDSVYNLGGHGNDPQQQAGGSGVAGVGGGGGGGGGGSDEDLSGWSSGKWGLTQQGSSTAWARLGEILGETGDEASSVGGQGSSEGDGEGGSGGNSNHRDKNDDDDRLGDEDDNGERDENRNDWEHLSPKEMKYPPLLPILVVATTAGRTRIRAL
ncbi:hypothetical protein IE53DRAFT_232364 [Violaceomyces palustris]|uniref:Uncharacterized protein n=1 Tax=Violaceomyces palustris TaxID=1673888 RepID=A0ACD0NPQ7_9BASI|nr:hypothetical protein IE53DRAFT_232364 [Violaceomyces palustris]